MPSAKWTISTNKPKRKTKSYQEVPLTGEKCLTYNPTNGLQMILCHVIFIDVETQISH
jgi:hypothetical protein